MAFHVGHSDAARQYIIQLVQNLLNDPETAARAVNAFRHSGHRI
jgi:hypothetical protein